MPISEATKKVLTGTVMEWSKFATERDKMILITNELTMVARKIVQECLQYLKAQNVDTTCETPDDLAVLGLQILINPVLDTNFPAVKASVVMKCGGATRAIVVNQNLTISAGGAPFTYDMFKKGVPDVFTVNAAEFVRDAFLYAARTGGKE
jgi:hypothetical protein